MTLEQLIAAARTRMDDTVEPYLCADEALTLHAAEGEAEAAMAADLLYDDSSDWLSLPLVAGQASYPLDGRVWRIDRAWLVLSGQTRESPLALTGIDRLRPETHRLGAFGCDGPATGRPTYAAQVGRTLRLWPTPDANAAGTLKLAVYRLPLEPLETDSDEPEIAAAHHMGLVDWMLYRAYSDEDSDLYAPRRAAEALEAFTARFGERPSATVHRQRNERRRTTAPYGGF